MDERIRRELARRAEQVDVSAAARERVLSGVRARRRWVRPVLGAAVAVAATVAGIAVVTDDLARPEVDPAPPPPPSATGEAEGEWRTEYWRDVQVDVPADWWFGGGPLGVGPNQSVLACGVGSLVSPTGERASPRQDDEPVPGYVGRPIAQTDVCGGNPSGERPTEPYVWFDAPIEQGTRGLGEGWVQETIEVSGSRITVATQDVALRERILDSATGGETCLANRDDLADPLVEPQPTETEGPLMCAYRGTRREAWLVYAAPLSQEQSGTFIEAFDAAPSWFPRGRGCDLGGDSEWVTLHLEATTYVVRLGFHGCPHVGDGDTLARLTPELVEPWLVGGVPTVLYGPTGGMGAMIDSFIGPQG